MLFTDAKPLPEHNTISLPFSMTLFIACLFTSETWLYEFKSVPSKSIATNLYIFAFTSLFFTDILFLVLVLYH